MATTTPTLNPLAILQETLEALEAGDYDRAYAACSADCRYISPLGEVRGRAAIQAADVAALEAMSSVHRRPGGVLLRGDHLMFWGVFGGTVAATGKHFEAEVLNVWSFLGNEVVEWYSYADWSGAAVAFAAG